MRALAGAGGLFGALEGWVFLGTWIYRRPFGVTVARSSGLFMGEGAPMKART